LILLTGALLGTVLVLPITLVCTLEFDGPGDQHPVPDAVGKLR